MELVLCCTQDGQKFIDCCPPGARVSRDAPLGECHANDHRLDEAEYVGIGKLSVLPPLSEALGVGLGECCLQLLELGEEHEVRTRVVASHLEERAVMRGRDDSSLL
jgi:hypothetical protein